MIRKATSAVVYREFVRFSALERIDVAGTH